jgi:hypothetical protein
MFLARSATSGARFSIFDTFSFGIAIDGEAVQDSRSATSLSYFVFSKFQPWTAIILHSITLELVFHSCLGVSKYPVV